MDLARLQFIRPGAWRAIKPCVLLAGIVAAIAGPAWGAGNEAGANWPQWRGPLGNGIAPKGSPPTTWSENENVKWKVKVPGRGMSTPIIWENQIFIQSAIPTGKKIDPPAGDNQAAVNLSPNVFGQAQTPPAGGQEGQRRRRPGGGGGFGRGEKPTEFHEFVLLSLDRKSGKTLWQQVVTEVVPHEGHHRDHGYASHSPITDGTLVFGWFGSRGLHCYDMSGKLQWSKDFGDQRTANGFGEGGSPALHGDKLVVTWDHEGDDDFIIALDKKTGKELWKQTREERTTWSTPFIIEQDGKAQVIAAASGKVRSYDLATGKVLWECGGLGSNVIPTPVTANGLLFAMSGHRDPALLAIKLGRSGDLTDTDAVAWKLARGTPYVPSPLLVDNKLYIFSGNNATLSCFEATSGKVLVDAERLQGPSGFYASPVSAGGHIYLAGRNGTSLVLKPSDKVEVIATNKLDEKFDASPAVVGNELFLRGHEYLYCLAEK
jgi:outer membrane protein assembly factor BamB